MYEVDRKPEVAVEIGEGVAVIRRKGTSRPTVAKMLKCEPPPSSSGGNDSIVRMVLDRLVHRPHETDFNGWRVSGAYVSVLEKSQ